MNTLVLMYVYFDSSGDIKAISPHRDESLIDNFNYTTLPLADVELFLTGKRNPFDFYVKKISKGGGEIFKLIRKEINISFTRTLNNYLTKVPTFNNEEPIIRIIANVVDKSISIKLDPVYKDLYKAGTEDEQDEIEKFLRNGESTLYFTKKNNPFFYLFNIRFTPRVLFDEEILYYTYPEHLDLSDSSVYTKKLMSSYGYQIKGKKNVIQVNERV